MIVFLGERNSHPRSAGVDVLVGGRADAGFLVGFFETPPDCPDDTPLDRHR